MIAKNKKHRERTRHHAERVTQEIEQRDKIIGNRREDALLTSPGASISNMRTEIRKEGRKEGNKVIQEKFAELKNMISRLTRSTSGQHRDEN